MTSDLFQGKHVLITGGTGSLGGALLRRLLSGESGIPGLILLFSRDEAKQYALRAHYQMAEPMIRERFNKIVRFQVGDIRNYFSVYQAIRNKDIVLNTAALKQVPTCEYYPYEAVQTNIEGAENIIRVIEALDEEYQPEYVIGISTDKACKPVNVMGMTKAIQERVFLVGNLRTVSKFICVRYGNVLASRGSVIPLFQEQIKGGGPVTVTTADMTRFLLTLDEAVDIVFAAISNGHRGETFIPITRSAKVLDIAKAMVGEKDIEIKVTGIRPGEKTDEVLVSEEEVFRTTRRGKYYVISSVLPEMNLQEVTGKFPSIEKEYSSDEDVLSYDGTVELLRSNGFLE